MDADISGEDVEVDVKEEDVLYDRQIGWEVSPSRASSSPTPVGGSSSGDAGSHHNTEEGSKASKFNDSGLTLGSYETSADRGVVIGCEEALGEKCGPAAECDTVLQGSKQHLCRFCGMAFVVEVDLQRHIDIAHKNMKRFSCSICGKMFGRKSYLRIHIDNIHEGLKKFSCSICGIMFGQKSHLR